MRTFWDSDEVSTGSSVARLFQLLWLLPCSSISAPPGLLEYLHGNMALPWSYSILPTLEDKKITLVTAQRVWSLAVILLE